jgi:hypothetical protein
LGSRSGEGRRGAEQGKGPFHSGCHSTSTRWKGPLVPVQAR